MAELPAKRAWAVAWAKDGEPIAKVAKAAKVTRTTIIRWCRAVGFDVLAAERQRVAEQRKAQTTQRREEAAAARLGLRQQRLRQIGDLRAAGVKWRAIGERLGLSEDTVLADLGRLAPRPRWRSARIRWTSGG